MNREELNKSPEDLDEASLNSLFQQRLADAHSHHCKFNDLMPHPILSNKLKPIAGLGVNFQKTLILSDKGSSHSRSPKKHATVQNSLVAEKQGSQVSQTEIFQTNISIRPSPKKKREEGPKEASRNDANQVSHNTSTSMY
mmetsp:Transcript_34458/g.52729  ORF Transcript_34458/g.52729 Transcript_34458/m.52729 type:complete len:140 (+) Transcript_34458:941-1360(+)